MNKTYTSLAEPSSALHSWGRVIAINTSSDYNKCAKLQRDGFSSPAVRNCFNSTYVYAYSYEAGWPYPNDGAAAVQAYGSVGNNDSSNHGLRGAGYY